MPDLPPSYPSKLTGSAFVSVTPCGKSGVDRVKLDISTRIHLMATPLALFVHN